jgi:hypothetical protein
VFRIAAKLLDSSDKARRRYDKAARAGVVASSQYLLNEIKKAYSDYYTSGDFRSTLQIRQAWRRADPEKNDNGWYTIVGVPTANVTPEGSKTPVDRGMVALAWEMGHDNLFTGKRERVRIAVPTAQESARGMADAWARVVKRYMEAP